VTSWSRAGRATTLISLSGRRLGEVVPLEKLLRRRRSGSSSPSLAHSGSSFSFSFSPLLVKAVEQGKTLGVLGFVAAAEGFIRGGPRVWTARPGSDAKGIDGTCRRAGTRGKIRRLGARVRSAGGARGQGCSAG